MAVVVLTNASILINSVDLSANANNVQLTYEVDSVEATVFGGQHSFVGGLQNLQVQVDLFQDFAAGKTEASVYGLVGTTTTLAIKASTAATSATNPLYTISNAYLASHTPVMGAVGELSKTSLTFTGGSLVKTTA